MPPRGVPCDYRGFVKNFDLKLPVKVHHCKRGTTKATSRMFDAAKRFVIQIGASKSSRHTEICEAAQALINGGHLRSKAAVVDYCAGRLLSVER